MKIKTGDTIRVITGKDKGKEGKVLQVFPALERVVIEGVNIASRHLRAQGKQTGQTVKFPAPLHVSNVALIGKNGAAGRIGYTFIEKDGQKQKVRVVRRRGATVDAN